MEIVSYLLDILKLTVAGLIVFFVAWYVIKTYLMENHKIQLIELKKASQAHTLPLRLQAYERMIIFLERINPANMLLRLHVQGLSVREFQHIVLADIRAEYQHNISQQLYVSEASWMLLKRLKEDTITLINNGANGISPESPSVELSKAVLTHLSGLEENPYDLTIAAIKREPQTLF